MLLLCVHPKPKGKISVGVWKCSVSTQMSMKLLKRRDGTGGGKWTGIMPRLALWELLDSGTESQRVKHSKFRRGLPGCL